MCHEIEPNPSKDRAMHEGDNPSFLDEFIKFTFFLTVLLIFVFLSKYRSKGLDPLQREIITKCKNEVESYANVLKND
jgi:hypothetical protein